MLIEHPFASGIPFGYFTESRATCQGCDAIFFGNEIPDDLLCPECQEILIEDEAGALIFNGDAVDGDDELRIVISESEAPDFFNQLDRALRCNFGISLSAVGGCDSKTAYYIGCRSGYRIEGDSVVRDEESKINKSGSQKDAEFGIAILGAIKNAKDLTDGSIDAEEFKKRQGILKGIMD